MLVIIQRPLLMHQLSFCSYEGGSTLRYSSEDHRYRNLQDNGHSSSDTDYYSLPNSAVVQLSITDTAKIKKTYNDTTVGINETHASRILGRLDMSTLYVDTINEKTSGNGIRYSGASNSRLPVSQAREHLPTSSPLMTDMTYHVDITPKSV